MYKINFHENKTLRERNISYIFLFLHEKSPLCFWLYEDFSYDFGYTLYIQDILYVHARQILQVTVHTKAIKNVMWTYVLHIIVPELQKIKGNVGSVRSNIRYKHFLTWSGIYKEHRYVQNKISNNSLDLLDDISLNNKLIHACWCSPHFFVTI